MINPTLFLSPRSALLPTWRKTTQVRWRMLQKHTNTQLPIRWIYKCNWHSFTVWNPLFIPRTYYTVLSLYKHATFNANSDATLHVFLCFVSGFLTFKMTLDFHLASTLDILKFLLQYWWWWERRKCWKKTKFILKLIQIWFTCSLFIWIKLFPSVSGNAAFTLLKIS